MTITPTENSKTGDRDLPKQVTSSTINSDRQYKDVAQVGQKAIGAVADERAKRSWFTRANDNIKSWFKKPKATFEKESVASSFSENQSVNRPSETSETASSSMQSETTNASAKLPSEKKRDLITYRLIFELFRDKVAQSEAQLRSKADHQENQLQSQHRLQRALTNISDLPEANLNKAQKDSAEELIQAVRNEGVDCTAEPWTRKNQKQNLQEEIRLSIDEKQSNHSILTNQYMQTSQAKSEFIQMCLKLLQSTHDAIVTAARAVGGR